MQCSVLPYVIAVDSQLDAIESLSIIGRIIDFVDTLPVHAELVRCEGEMLRKTESRVREHWIQSCIDSEISKLKSKEQQTRSSRDSLAAVLQPYLGYDALLRANMKRDEAYAALPFKYGDKVLLLPDSAHGMISEVIMGGNPWNYYIRYKIMLKGGKESEVYPSQLVAAP